MLRGMLNIALLFCNMLMGVCRWIAVQARAEHQVSDSSAPAEGRSVVDHRSSNDYHETLGSRRVEVPGVDEV